jgi:hypothetical protein
MKQLVRVCAAALLLNLSACSPQAAKSAANNMNAQVKQFVQSFQSSSDAPDTPEEPPAPVPKAATKPAHRGKRLAPKPEPTQQELVEYLRGKLLALSPSDAINDNIEVAFNPSTTALTVTQPSGRCDQFLSALDGNSLAWDIFDPGDAHNSREELLRLTVTSTSGKAARACYDKENRLDRTVAANRVRFLFSLRKVEQFPGFQDNMSAAVKKLIELSGGVAEKAIF